MPALSALEESLLQGSMLEHALGKEFLTLIARQEIRRSGLLLRDARHGHLSCNARFREIWGLSSVPSEAHLIEEVLGRIAEPAELRRSLASWMEDSVDSHQVEVLLKDGRRLESMLSPLRSPGGDVLGTVWRVCEVGARVPAEEASRHRELRDPLTALPNRACYRECLAAALSRARESGNRMALLLLDIDRFNLVNDTLGYEVGDALLRVVARRLADGMRQCDMVARLGEDEFTVILESVSSVEDAIQAARRILGSLAAPIQIGEHELFMTVSLGISLFPADGDEASTLHQNAEVALYRAKELRNTYFLYAPSLQQAAQERLSLENHLHKAIERQELLLHYQPQVDLCTGRIVGAEALIRWNHPTLGMLPPTKFVPIAEESGLILPITEWVIETACRQAAAWLQQGLPPLRIGVNLSALYFKHTDVAESVSAAAAQAGIVASHLDMELTESIFLEDIRTVLGQMNLLRAKGCSLSLDDFGTGFSSLAYLRSWPISTLKIDQSFVRGVLTNPEDAAIVQAIISLAHALELRVIAEGVETADQLAHLRQLNCDEYQGYHFSRPLSAQAFVELRSST